MIIYKTECLEVSLPEPRAFDNQQSYIIYCISNGYQIDTRTARYIGIGNLHTQANNVKKKGIKLTIDKVKSKCRKTSEILPQPVDLVYMTPLQQKIYWGAKGKPTKEAAQ